MPNLQFSLLNLQYKIKLILKCYCDSQSLKSWALSIATTVSNLVGGFSFTITRERVCAFISSMA